MGPHAASQQTLVVGNWRLELIEAHHDLFQPPADFPGAAQGTPECGAGWRDLPEHLCVRTRTAVQADGGPFQFDQIKEKYGTLRVHWDGAISPESDEQVEDAIALAEARSAVTCEVCGKEGRLRGGARLSTCCMAHSESRPAVKRRSGLENVPRCDAFPTAGASSPAAKSQMSADLGNTDRPRACRGTSGCVALLTGISVEAGEFLDVDAVQPERRDRSLDEAGDARLAIKPGGDVHQRLLAVGVTVNVLTRPELPVSAWTRIRPGSGSAISIRSFRTPRADLILKLTTLPAPMPPSSSWKS